jgi:hypothetical protein
VRAVGVASEEAEFFDEAFAKVIAVSRRAGMDPHYGRQLGALFREAGLSNVASEAFAFEWSSADSLADFYAMTFERLRAPVLDQGVLSAQELDRLVRLMKSPGFHGISNTVFTTRRQWVAASAVPADAGRWPAPLAGKR